MILSQCYAIGGLGNRMLGKMVDHDHPGTALAIQMVDLCHLMMMSSMEILVGRLPE